MDELRNFLNENHSIIFTLSVFWVILGFGFLLWRRKLKGMKIPKTNDEGVMFYERFVSGYSHRSWVTRIGGAANCLTVIVTESDFVVTTFFPFTAIAGIYDLEHSVSISEIIDTERNSKEIEIQFKRTDQSVCKLTLRFKDSDGFEDALLNQL